MEILPLTVESIAGYVVSPVAALLFSPLVPGIINRIKALFAGRNGPPLLQPYFDLLRLFRKGSVTSTTTSWIFRMAPVMVFAATLCATLFVPITTWTAPIVIPGDLIMMLYLLCIARFFIIISALDTGSPFEGMGASREAFFSAIAEPVTFICFINVMRSEHTVSIGAALCSSCAVVSDSISVLLAALPLFVVLLAENARIPFDDPNTHLELTMIHEVMILDNSGAGLGLLEYAAAIKLWFFSLVIGRILLPIPGYNPLLQLGMMLLIICGIAVAVGITESIMARVRLLKVPQLLFGAGVASLLGFFFSVTGAFSW